ncbi:12887_t:CDS:10 [Dentiscutata erythropus]|uniref:12887_t:CDS:1 n=1 Tax=Dentiscutata erythropus TaxID=1348616 RepID=A0A9N9HTZ5_9GLOM|nr:12887_t:CDS:10 [Dentiscutata erythropus]
MSLDAIIKNKDRKITLKDQADELETLAQRYGLEDTQIAELLEFILKGKLDDSDVRKLIKLLVPRKKVSEMSAIKIFGNLGNRNMKYSIQALLLRWVVLVYGFIEDHSKIYRLYGADSMSSLIPHDAERAREVCCDYTIINRIDLQTRTGYEPHIQGLLKLYKDYFPNLVTIDIQPSRSITFKCPDIAWYQLINQVQRRWNNDKSLSHMPLTRPMIPKMVEKRRKIEHNDIPTTRTYNVTQKSITLNEISDIRQLANNIDKVELPNQLASVLDHRMLQHVIVSNPERVAIARISYWIDQYLMETVYWSDQNATKKIRIDCLLNKIVTMTEFMKELLPVIQEFLMKYIQSWDGGECHELIFRLLTFLRPGPYNQLYEKILKPLQSLYNNSSASWKSKLIHCYAGLLKYWTLLYEGYYERIEQENHDNEDLENSIGNLSIDRDYSQTIRNFIDYVDRTILMPEDEDQVEVQHAILSFMEISTLLQLKYECRGIVFPSYKDEFDKCERETSIGGALRYNINQINDFNSFVADIYNGIWKNRPFTKFDKAKGFQLDE